MTALGSVPKAHTQGEPEGTWNLEKLHLELKYLGRKLADAKLQRKGHSIIQDTGWEDKVKFTFLISALSFFVFILLQL